MIVLDENAWAEKHINTRTLGKKPFETLTRVARYYFEFGYNKHIVRQKLDEFFLLCNPSASLPKWSSLLDHAIAAAASRKAVHIDHIDITQPEIDLINAVPGIQTRRLAFTLLCLSKYWNEVNHHADNWVNSSDSDIMRMANINTSIKRQSAMFHTLYALGFIRFSRKVDNMNVQVCFAKDGDVALSITDFRNLGYQYLRYLGECFTECENCGVVIRANVINGRPRKYCNECAHEALLSQYREASRKYRHKNV